MPYQPVTYVIATDATVLGSVHELLGFWSGFMLLSPETCKSVSNRGEYI